MTVKKPFLQGMLGILTDSSLSFEERVSDIALYVQHWLNPLHIYCRLIDLGCKKGPSINLCRVYDSRLYDPFIKPATIKIHSAFNVNKESGYKPEYDSMCQQI